MNVNSNFQHYEYLIVKDQFKDKFEWGTVINNPNAIHLLETELDKNLDKVKNWANLFSNPNALHLFEKYFDYVHFGGLSSNKNVEVFKILEKHLNNVRWDVISYRQEPEAIAFLEKHLDRLNDECWRSIQENPAAVEIIKNNMDKINLASLSKNTSPEVIEIIKNNYLDELSHFEGYILSGNPSAMSILRENPDLIDLDALASNPNPEAVAIVIDEENLDELNIEALSLNPGVIDFLENNLDIVDWQSLSLNSAALHILEANFENIYWDDIFERDEDTPSKAFVKFILNNYSRLDEETLNCCDFWYNVSLMPEFISLISHHLEKVNPIAMGFNPELFQYNYTKIKARVDINEYFYHPKFYCQYLEKYGDEITEDQDHYLDWFLFKR